MHDDLRVRARRVLDVEVFCHFRPWLSLGRPY
jgi:hypothetical protein